MRCNLRHIYLVGSRNTTTSGVSRGPRDTIDELESFKLRAGADLSLHPRHHHQFMVNKNKSQPENDGPCQICSRSQVYCLRHMEGFIAFDVHINLITLNLQIRLRDGSQGDQPLVSDKHHADSFRM